MPRPGREGAGAGAHAEPRRDVTRVPAVGDAARKYTTNPAAAARSASPFGSALERVKAIMATSAQTLRPHFGPPATAEPERAPRSIASALRWLIVPTLGLAVFAAVRRRTHEPPTQYVSDEWLRANGHRRQHEI